MINKNFFPNVNELINDKKSFVNIAKNKTYYNEFSEIYELISARNKETEKEIFFLVDIINKYSKGVKILDLACGVGRHSRKLSKLGYDVYGIDFSKSMLDKALSLDKKTKYILGDVRKICVSNINLAFCFWTAYNYFSQIKDMISFINSVYSSLDDNGILIIDSSNFFKIKPKIDLRRRVYSTNRYNIELLIRKRIDLEKLIQDSIYVYLVIDKTIKETFSSVDTELVKIYTIEDIKTLVKNKFEILHILGDFNLEKNIIEKFQND